MYASRPRHMACPVLPTCNGSACFLFGSLFVVAVVNSCRRRRRYDSKIVVLGGEKAFFLTAAAEAASGDLGLNKGDSLSKGLE